LRENRASRLALEYLEPEKWGLESRLKEYVREKGWNLEFESEVDGELPNWLCRVRIRTQEGEEKGLGEIVGRGLSRSGARSK